MGNKIRYYCYITILLTIFTENIQAQKPQTLTVAATHLPPYRIVDGENVD